VINLVNFDKEYVNMSVLEKIKRWAGTLRGNIKALSLARKDPRVPWAAKAVLVLVVAYALSPIDLIPDFIPVLGLLDDLILLPLGIALAIRLMPKDVWAECQLRAGCNS
jgi:uncharacterized membrane protein YkvA (DUF1232 family)